MLNEMNPKLRALLAAGLIGTAGLGAVSCSMPTDNPSDVQYTIEQPTPENPEEIEEIEDSEDSEEITDSEDSEDFEDPEDSEYTVTFETLGVEEYAESLARATKLRSRNDNGEVVVSKFDEVPITDGNTVYIYRNGQFELASSEDEDAFDDVSELKDVTYICYKESNIRYFVPENKVNDFDAAIAAYNNAQ